MNPTPAAASEPSASAPTDSVDVLTSAIDQLADLVDRVDPRAATSPTPCASWDVAALLEHVVADLPPFISATKDEEADWTAKHPSVGPDWAPAFRQGGADLIAAWRAAGDPTEPGIPADMVTAEFAIHAWDLASALGEPVDLDPAPAKRGLAMMQGALQPSMRGDETDGKVFGPEVSLPGDASAYERLVAFAGRDPRWSGPGSLSA